MPKINGKYYSNDKSRKLLNDVGEWYMHGGTVNFDLATDFKYRNKYSPSEEEVADLKKWMDRRAVTVTQDGTTLYRGTLGPDVFIDPARLESEVETPEAADEQFFKDFKAKKPMTAKHYISTSTDLKIAKGFAGVGSRFEGKGYLHTLHLKPGCRVVPFDKYYPGPEKEQIILPGHTFTPVKRTAHNLTWTVQRGGVKRATTTKAGKV